VQSSKLKKRRRPNGKFTYYASVQGRQHGLGSDYQAAKQKFAKMLGDQGGDSPNPLVSDVIGDFLAWSKRNQELGTHRFYQSFLDHSQANKVSFNTFTCGLRVADLKRNHVTKWLDQNYSEDSANYRNGAVRAAKRALKWAADEDLIAYSPLAKVKLPTPEHRELVYRRHNLAEIAWAVGEQKRQELRRFPRLPDCNLGNGLQAARNRNR